MSSTSRSWCGFHPVCEMFAFCQSFLWQVYTIEQESFRLLTFALIWLFLTNVMQKEHVPPTCRDAVKLCYNMLVLCKANS